MNGSWKTVRVFISSTFRDMQAERDHLVRFVFPRLRDELLPRRIHLLDVDLRWGVTSEQDAFEVCREIINECRPRFLCMLGGRYGWVPPGKTRSITADEVHYGVLDRTLKDRGFAYFYFRDDASTAEMVEITPGEFREPQGSDNEKKLSQLKYAIADAGLNPFTYPAQWDNESRRLTSLKRFGDRVYDDLLQSCKDDPKLAENLAETAAQLDEFAEENAAMEAFIEERSERFVLGSRETVLNELLAHASTTGGNGYVCLTGAPGSGKSALFACLSRTLSSQPTATSALVISHFVGASPGSTDVRRTLRRLCHELKLGCPEISADIPDDQEELRVTFPDFLRQACTKKPVVILLDAVNQFDPALQFAGLWWLPEELPDNACLILSTLPGPTLDNLRQRRHPPSEVTLGALTQADGEAIIKEFLRRYRKTMPDAQRAALLAKTDAGTPLYLLAALEELRTLGTYEEITDRIAQLPSETQALFTWILKRLEDDDGFRDASGQKIGSELVHRFASLMGVSRHGLSQGELSELLAPGDAKAKPPILDDAQGNVAALVQLLRVYLMRRGELLDFYHGQFRLAVEKQFLKTEVQRQASHEALARYFRDQVDPLGDSTWAANIPRGFSELPHHQRSARMWREVEDTLTDLMFVEAKCRAGMPHDLARDYLLAIGALSHESDRLRAFSEFVLRHISHLAREPRSVFQLAANEPDESPVSRSAMGRWHSGVERRLWIRHLNKPQIQSQFSLTYDGHRSAGAGGGGSSNWLTCCRYSPDGSLVASSDFKGAVHIREAATGNLRRVLRGHDRAANSCAWSPDSSYLVVACWGKLLVWNVVNGQQHCILEGHSAEDIKCCHWSPNGAYITSGGGGYGSEHEVIIWNADDGSIKRRLLGHSAEITSLSFNHESSCVVSCSGQFQADNELIVWSLDGGGQLARWKSERREITSCSFTPDGGRIAFAQMSGDLKGLLVVMDAALRHECFKVSVNSPAGLSCSPNGRLIAIGSRDHNVYLFDAADGRQLSILRGHGNWVESCDFSPDSNMLVSGSRDCTVRTWPVGSSQSGHAGEDEVPHRMGVRCGAFSSDGSLFISGGDSDEHYQPAGSLVLWDVHAGAHRATLLQGENEILRCAFLAGDQSVLASTGGGYFKEPILYSVDLADGASLVRLKDYVPVWVVHRKTGLLCILNSRETQGCATIIDTKTWKITKSFPAQGNCILDAGHRLLIGGQEGNRAVLIDIATGSMESLAPAFTSPVESVYCSCDGRFIAVTSKGSSVASSTARSLILRMERELACWDLYSGREPLLHLARGDYRSCCFCESWFVVSVDGNLLVYELPQYLPSRNLSAHDYHIMGCVAIPGRPWIASVSLDMTIQLWDLETMGLLASFHLRGRGTFIAASPDGSRIAAGDELGHVYLLEICDVLEETHLTRRST